MEVDTLLDDTWIRDFEKTHDVYKDFYKTDLYFIHLTFIYINRNNEIDKIKNEPFILNKPNFVSHEEHVEILKKNLIDNNKRYSLLSILRYNINLEPDEITNFIKNRENQQFLSVVKNIGSVAFEKSIHMFQDLNELVFVFYEKSNELKKHNPKTSSRKMPSSHSLHNTHKKTFRKRYKD